MTEFNWKRTSKLILKNFQLILTLLSVVIGITVGLLGRSAQLSSVTIELIGFPGEVLMNMLKMMILPLIAASLISGLSQLDPRQSEQIGILAIWYYTMSTFMAVATGIVLVLIIHPGDPSIKIHHNTLNKTDKIHEEVNKLDKLLDLIRNMFPENIIQATFETVETSRKVYNDSSGADIIFEKHYIPQINVLGIIFFCIFIGIVISYVGERAKPLLDLFIALDIVISTIVGIIMWYSPIGIASLIAAKILEVNNLISTVKSLAAFMATVIIGLAIQNFITLPFIYYFSTKKNPYIFMKGMAQAAVTALGTASTAASLPVTFRCLEENNGIDPKFTKFVLPTGSIVNMDGTALYEAVASIFIAQLNGLHLGIGRIFTISLTATLAAIGAASIPSAGLVTMIIVLTSVGLPADDISIIIAVDWFLDRLRTCVNVMGDSYACAFVQSMYLSYKEEESRREAREMNRNIRPINAPNDKVEEV